MFASASFLLIYLSASVLSQTLSRKTRLSGSTFFDGFKYNASAIDYFNYGNVHWVDQTTAQSSNLTYINSQGNAVIRVDNTTSGAGDSTFGRNSVLLISNDTIVQGSLVVMDAVHLPYGCSVWPAFWMLNSEGNMTDVGGEIDIFEGVNDVTTNQYTLHTAAGCNHVNSTSLPYANSTVLSTNCDHTVNQNQGCAFVDDRASSYGSEFAENGGGVFAVLWDGDGIQIWFFSRADIPADLNSSSPAPSSWVAPAASFPAAGCNPSTFFNPQNLILDINVCGSFAGNAAVFAQTCSGVCTDYVAQPSNYDNAYFEIKYIDVYTGASTGDNAPSQTVSSTVSTSQDTSSAPHSNFIPIITCAILALSSLVIGHQIF